jgi:hypothetical protein
MTQQEYDRNPAPYERDAYATGKLVNKGNGSVSVYDAPH